MMRYFWGYIGLFTSVWVWMIVHQGAQPAISILFCAGSFGLLFMLFVPRAQPWVLWLFSGVLFIHAMYTEFVVATTVLLLHASVLAAQRFTQLSFYVSISMNQLLISILLLTSATTDWVFLLTSLLVTCTIGYTYTHIEARRSMEDMYTQLTSDYRRLRRAHVDAENEVRMKERTNIARTIHDSVGHRLTALMMHLEMLAIQRKDETFRELKVMAEEGLQETREAVHALQHEEIEGISTVIHMIQKLEAESRMFVHFTTKQGVLSMRLSPEKNVVLYRVIQEALTNAMRHAQTKVVHITLGKTAIEEVFFEIENEADTSSAIKKGFGLIQMRKRIEEIGGTMSIHSHEGTFIIRGIIPQDGGGEHDVERDDR